VSKPLNSRKKVVELQPQQRASRIRRDPIGVQVQQLSRNAWWDSREWEIRFAIIGILFFALGISALVVDMGHLFGL
jgi:hypothetical protein